jgi:hypothetical protein
MKAYQGQGDSTKVESLFDEMKELSAKNRELEPQIDAYNVWIRAIGVTQGPEAAEAKLYALMNRFRQGDQSCQPNADTFRNVIFGYNQDRKQQHSAATVSKLDQLLQIQDSFLALQNTVDEPWTPDERLYNIVMSLVARSKDPQKAVRIQRMLQRLQKATTLQKGSLRRMYYSQLSACAYVTKDSTAQDKAAAFDIASDTWNTLKSDTGMNVDSAVAGMFLMACRTLLEPSPQRDAVVQAAFDECCQRGIVNHFVLDELEGLTDGVTQLQWFGGLLEDGVRIKKEWQRNVEVDKR